MTPSDFFVGIQLVRMLQNYHFSRGHPFYHSHNTSPLKQDRSVPPLISLRVSVSTSLRLTKLKDTNAHLPENSKSDPYKSFQHIKDPVVAQCFVGDQPVLRREDIEILQEMEYYFRFVYGIFGLTLHLLTHFWCGFCLNPPLCRPTGVKKEALFGGAACGNYFHLEM